MYKMHIRREESPCRWRDFWHRVGLGFIGALIIFLMGVLL